MYTQQQLMIIWKLLRATNNVGNIMAETGYSREHIRNVFRMQQVAEAHPQIVELAVSMLKESGIYNDVKLLTEILN